jgi:hypothetical protein
VHEYLIRFVFGGLATVATGAIANVFGPETGGLFLAFPAIFSASATLIEKHERERKEKIGLRGETLGSLGLLVFGAAIWLLAPRSAWLALIVGSAAWFAVSIFLWSIRRWIWACR